MQGLPSTRLLIERELQQQSGCSKTALRNVLGVLSKHNVLREDIQASKRNRKRSMQAAVDDLANAQTPYGPVMQCVGLGELAWDIVNPFAVLHQLSSVSPDFANLLSGIFEEKNPAPLKFVLYVDECQPGNCLRPDYARKMQCIYWTFVDFPGWLLQRAEGWFVFGLLRSSVVAKLPGAISAVMKKVLQVFFPAEGNSFATGFSIPARGTTWVATAEFWGFLADEKALKEVLGVKGASGSKPCPTCANVVQHWPVHQHPGLQNLKCCRKTDLVYHTNESYWEMVDYLRAQKLLLGVGKFQELEQLLGLNYDPDSLLFEDSLRHIVKPVDHCLRDWMHTFVSNGVAGTETARLLRKLHEEGYLCEDVMQYMTAHVLPKRMGKVGKEWLDASRISDDHMRLASASDLLTIVPLLDEYMTEVVQPGGQLDAHRHCFAKLRLVLELCALGSEESASRVTYLETAIVEHAEAYVALYPDYVKPKFHHALHLPEHIRFVGKLLSCWVTERKHRAVKAACLYNFKTPEKSTTKMMLVALLGLGDGPAFQPVRMTDASGVELGHWVASCHFLLPLSSLITCHLRRTHRPS